MPGLAKCTTPPEVRDRFLGWSDEARERNVYLLAYKTRFLILPWVRMEYLASHILGRMAKRVPQHWQRIYVYPVYWLETFVDTSRFAGHVIVRPTGR
jgi:hypothetical protein